MKCKKCGEERKLVKAHIVPRSFYMDLRASNEYLNVVPGNPAERITISRIGDYDQNILCQECDRFLGVFDDYGKSVLLDGKNERKEIIKGGVVAGWEISDINASKLEKFILSVLWRASITQRTFFQRVNLGPHEFALQKYIWSEESHNSVFGCVVSKFTRSSKAIDAEKVMLSPHRFRCEGINYYSLYMGGYAFWIRIDQRKSKGLLARIEISSGKNLIIVSRDFDDSKEFKAMFKAANLH